MSDIFNQQNVKSSVTAYLKQSGENSNSDDLLIYLKGVYKEPDIPDSFVTYRNLGEWISKNRLPVFRPLEFPALTEIPADDVLPDRILNIEAFDLKDKMLNMPIGEAGVIPTYRPNWMVEEPLKSVIPSISYHTAHLISTSNNETYNNYYIRTAVELIDKLSSTRFTSGTLSGQMTRLLQGHQVNNGLKGNHKNKTYKELGLSINQVVSMIEETLPFSNMEPSIDLAFTISQYIYNEQEALTLGKDSDLPTINLNSAAGLPFLGKKKKEVTLECIALADNVIANISNIIKENKISSSVKRDELVGLAMTDAKSAASTFGKEVADLLYRDYWYLRCGLMFPKAERYDVESIDTKTRNIWSASYVLHLIGNMISNYPISTSLNVLTCERKTSSLSKFTATQGGLNYLMNYLLTCTEITELIYADNVYLFYPQSGDWYSIDLTKGEANITREMAMSVAVYLLKFGWTDQYNNPLFSNTWAIIAMYIIPMCTVDSMALIKNFLLKNPGQGSGNPWTFINNHVASTILVHFWKQMGRPHPTDSAAMEKLMTQTGIDFKLELHTKKLPEKLAQCRKDFIPINDRSKPRNIIPLDMLGWDVTYTEYGFTPVLNKDRLFKSICCPQPTSTTFDTKEKKMIHKYVQSFALLSVGAWAYPNVGLMVEEYVRNYWKTIQEMMANNPNPDIVTKLVDSELKTSPYAEVIQFLNPDSPLHLQNWPQIFFGAKEVNREPPKHFTRREFEGLSTEATATQKSSHIKVQRNKGLLVSDPTFEKLGNIMRRVAPDIYQEELKASKGSNKLFGYTRMANETLRTLRDKYTDTQISKMWEDALLGESTIGDLVMEGVDYNTALILKFVPPPPDTKVLSPRLFTYYTNIRTSKVDGEMLEEYDDVLKVVGPIGLKNLQEYDAYSKAASAYMTRTEASWDLLESATPLPEPRVVRAKKIEEAENPYVSFRIRQEMTFGDISKATGNLIPSLATLRSKTEKRRLNRKKARK